MNMTEIKESMANLQNKSLEALQIDKSMAKAKLSEIEYQLDNTKSKKKVKVLQDEYEEANDQYLNISNVIYIKEQELGYR